MKNHHLVLFFTSLALLTPSLAQPGPVSAAPKTPPAAETIEAKIRANEKDTWEALKRHDASAYAKFSLPGAWGIFEIGSLQVTQKVTAQVPRTEILEYKMDDIKVSVLNEHTAIIHYKIFARMSANGKEIPGKWLQGSTVWVKMGKAWKAAMYQETPLPAQP